MRKILFSFLSVCTIPCHQVVSNKKLLDGFRLFLWPEEEEEEDSTTSVGEPEVTRTIRISGDPASSQQQQTTVGRLRANTPYAAFLVPTARSLFGRPSNLLRFRTGLTGRGIKIFLSKMKVLARFNLFHMKLETLLLLLLSPYHNSKL
jgi:hypothetical protein